jgi:hypothetical protein
MNIGEDYEYFDEVKHLLDIPEPRKSLEEIKQELDEKFEKLIVRTKRNFYASKLTTERNCENKFQKIFDGFEYAKEHGCFPQKLTLDYSNYSKFVVTGSSVESSFVIKQGKKHEGYYTNGNRRYLKYYMPDKPNVIVRFFMKTCLGFYWVDDKNG